MVTVTVLRAKNSSTGWATTARAASCSAAMAKIARAASPASRDRAGAVAASVAVREAWPGFRRQVPERLVAERGSFTDSPKIHRRMRRAGARRGSLPTTHPRRYYSPHKFASAGFDCTALARRRAQQLQGEPHEKR